MNRLVLLGHCAHATNYLDAPASLPISWSPTTHSPPLRPSSNICRWLQRPRPVHSAGEPRHHHFLISSLTTTTAQPLPTARSRPAKGTISGPQQDHDWSQGRDIDNKAALCSTHLATSKIGRSFSCCPWCLVDLSGEDDVHIAHDVQVRATRNRRDARVVGGGPVPRI